MLRDLGLYPNQELLLMQLEDVESRSQSDLVRTLTLDHSTVAKSLRRMETAGLVARRPSASDRRAVDVSLTQRGTELLERIRTVALAPDLTDIPGIAGVWPPAVRRLFLAEGLPRRGGASAILSRSWR